MSQDSSSLPVSFAALAAGDTFAAAEVFSTTSRPENAISVMSA